jgi:hypothetical protein
MNAGTKALPPLWPLIDPAVPDRDRDRLGRHPDLLLAADARPYRRPGTLLGTDDEGIGWVSAVVMLLTICMLGFGGQPLMGAAVSGGMGLFVLTCLVVEHPAARTARRLHGRYLTRADLDTEAADVLERAYVAVASIESSDVVRDGLLDTVRNGVVLRHHLWEIGEALRRQTRVRRDADPIPYGPDQELNAIVRRQREALAASVADVTRRVRGLEDYADRVRAADEALALRRHRERAHARDDAYNDLLAHIHGNADLEIAALADEARDLHARLDEDDAA